MLSNRNFDGLLHERCNSIANAMSGVMKAWLSPLLIFCYRYTCGAETVLMNLVALMLTSPPQDMYPTQHTLVCLVGILGYMR